MDNLYGGNKTMDARNDKPFDPAAFFPSVGLGRRIGEAEPEQCFFTQGDEADSVFCLLTGRAKIGIVSAKGKQATVLLLSPGDFFGEESLAGVNGLRAATVTAVNRCTALKIEREHMLRIMHREHEFCDRFLSY